MVPKQTGTVFLYNLYLSHRELILYSKYEHKPIPVRLYLSHRELILYQILAFSFEPFRFTFPIGN